MVKVSHFYIEDGEKMVVVHPITDININFHKKMTHKTTVDKFFQAFSQ